MPQSVVFKISGGTTTFLVNEHTKAFIPANAPIRRASHVEPMDRMDRLRFRAIRAEYGDESEAAAATRMWDVLWQVDLSPVGGPLVEGFKDRAKAIDWEIQWLNSNFLSVK